MARDDRTLLAQLGFADPDKGEPRHDLACRYLALRENRLPLWQAVGLDKLRSDEVQRQAPTPQRPSFEVRLATPSGYTVGFLDVVLPYRVPVLYAPTTWDPEPELVRVDVTIFVEVKGANSALGVHDQGDYQLDVMLT